MPAATDLHPSDRMALVSTVAVVVPACRLMVSVMWQWSDVCTNARLMVSVMWQKSDMCINGVITWPCMICLSAQTVAQKLQRTISSNIIRC